MQNYLSSEEMEIQNNERKFIFQTRSQILFQKEKEKHFQNMYNDAVCD